MSVRSMFRMHLLLLLWGASILHSGKSEDEVKCELAAFLENADGTDPKLIDYGVVLADSTMTSCTESVEKCASIAEKQAQDGTGGGNFTLSVNDREGYTVGDVLCDKADVVQENVRHKMVRVYWRLCGSEWRPTPFRMPEPLCCEDGLYVPCDKLRSEL